MIGRAPRPVGVLVGVATGAVVGRGLTVPLGHGVFGVVVASAVVRVTGGGSAGPAPLDSTVADGVGETGSAAVTVAVAVAVTEGAPPGEPVVASREVIMNTAPSPPATSARESAMMMPAFDLFGGSACDADIAAGYAALA